MKVIHVLHFYTAGALAAILLRHSFLPAYFLPIMKFLYSTEYRGIGTVYFFASIPPRQNHDLSFQRQF